MMMGGEGNKHTIGQPAFSQRRASLLWRVIGVGPGEVKELSMNKWGQEAH